jgi:hypothetical protein
MKTTFLIPVAGVIMLLVAGCNDNSGNAAPPSTNSTASDNNSSPTLPPEVYAQKKTDIASINQAIQQYDAAEGHNPKDLQELAPNYISKVPQPPAGYKYDYDPNSGLVNMVQQQP